ncbi:hypothetical protein V1477_004146 [Vespula maculifrons]|uniref:Uncharacterized protein n=1 Tax=Vespula maculifrons TaxID=7453 RepID=A0ABD2CRN4_VESMC
MTAEAAVTATTAAQQQQQPQQQQVHEPMPPSHLVSVVARLGRVLRALRLISRANLGACIQWVSAVNAGKHPPAMAVLVVWLPLREPARQVFIPFAVMTSTSSKAVRVCQGSPRFARDSISESGASLLSLPFLSYLL